MKSPSKAINLLLLGAAGVVWFLTKHYTDVLVGYFQLERRVGASAEVIQHLLPVLVGVLVFVVMKKNHKIYGFVHNALGELDKVTWPGKKEVQAGTVVVVITCLLAGAALGVLDIGLNWMIKTIIGA